jgi:membrane fusion protein
LDRKILREGRESVQQNLFRQEVFDVQETKSLGTIRIATPVSHQTWSLVALATVAAILVWLLVGQYTRREHVSGTLVPKAGLISITARNTGTVLKVHVAEGDMVHRGDPLLTISGERSSASLGDTARDISTHLQHDHTRLTVEIDDAKRLQDEQADDLRMQQRMLERQIAQYQAQTVIEKREVDQLAELLGRFEALGTKGYVSPLQVQQQRTDEINAQQQLKTLEREQAEAQQQFASVGDQLKQLPLTTETKVDDLRRQLSQDDQALDQNEAEREVVIRAPEDGLVSSELAVPGQATVTGQTLLTILPKGSPLEAQLLVPSSAIGFVHVGTKVVLHYQAFPYQKFGSQCGLVQRLSRNALSPAEITSLFGQAPPSEPLYRVKVSLTAQQVEAYGRPELLKPGMLVEADLLLDKRRMIEWIFEPLYGMASRYGTRHD